tara:strand:- start:1253 stop:1930 length:678 start_codon:yes stop_codon:yes gene_type:complete
MKITKEQLTNIIKEEIEKINLEEGWKDIAMAGALGLSTLASPSSAAAQAPQTSYSQVSAASANSIESIAQRLTKYVGPRHTHWLNKRAWDEDSIESETLTAWHEVLTGVDTFWTSTLPIQKAGCRTNPETEMCSVLKRIEGKLRSDLDPVMADVESLLDRPKEKRRRISPRLIKKMNNIIDLWVPATKSENTFIDTKGWEKAADGYKPGETKKGKGTFVPAGDDL